MTSHNEIINDSDGENLPDLDGDTHELLNVTNLKTTVPKISEQKENVWTISIQVFVPFVVAGLGMVGAGLVLDVVQKKTVSIEDPTDVSKMDVNSAAVCGVLSVGGGLSQLEEITTSLNMPRMSSRTYSKYHDTVCSSLFARSLEEMKMAAEEEEARLAVENGKLMQTAFLLSQLLLMGRCQRDITESQVMWLKR
ncbi:hypothetical protein PR048_013566 [Dryococelus australis]|uniref:Mutator-like transposase domain-containing protein n=1 Tax=Dryococelus australis TaxID=614101 RepID=A0ABQ9HSP3_9NEOP|nr:hypothetical protein PR048_013566 [Dryococelus australis]